MPSSTFIAREEKSMPGFKALKDKLTLLCVTSSIEKNPHYEPVHLVLLLIDSVPGYSKALIDMYTKIKVLMPASTSTLQPMDQGVILIFKSYYLRNT
ncbi:hypothetical protein QTO34_009297 [Cnephaeus nilssonii]|uniref:DDE-1 domain-containing protein n=1 Tax=Cnephaeus nilssonii TaxID=3371016 RepID=A0AA40HHI1_CNENI|nr:hypothetical protein QTO34_009297 [Eptesicus nilssonii]